MPTTKYCYATYTTLTYHIDVEHHVKSAIIFFPSNSANNTVKCTTITITDDLILEQPEQSLSVVLAASDSGVLVQDGKLFINIIDDDSKYYSHYFSMDTLK